MTTRILSGMQPTNNLHLGNYLGALKNWVHMQADFNDCLYMVADQHAITMPQDPNALRQSSRELAATYIAAGIDPAKSFVFIQSHVPEHTELAWLFSCLTPLGWLNRMTQFKDKSGKNKDTAPLGLYSYPVLMAADILLYKATHVPTGEDQKQHVELTRDIAGAFNRHCNTDFFPLPEPTITGAATRVRSLRDGTKKMSKSDPSDYSRINLTDDAETIKLKIQKAKSDTLPLPDRLADLENRPEADNLITIYAALAGRSRDDVVHEFAGASFSAFKPKLTELAVHELAPIATRLRQLLSDPAEIDRLLAIGAEKCRNLAIPHMRAIRDLMGFAAPR